MSVRSAQITKKVNELLGKFTVETPPVPIRKIARGCGARIVKIFDADMDGFLYREGSEIIIGVNKDQAPVRQRFTIAHEVGHLLLHEHNEVHIDRGFQVRLRNGVSAQGINTEEMEANRFAAELLMPISLLRLDLESRYFDLADDQSLRELAKRYGVSTQAITIRLNGLGYSPHVDL